jgi:hypothetical protein
MPEWLELELAHQLSPAAAPDALWERIQKGRPVVRRAVPRWPIAAILTLMVAAATLWLAAKGQEPALDFAGLALQQLQHPAPLDLLSSDPATLLIARTGTGASTPHGRLSWKSGGLTYALACSDAERPEAACLLCHASL